MLQQGLTGTHQLQMSIDFMFGLLVLVVAVAQPMFLLMAVAAVVAVATHKV
jgi:hypothetical protein